jgi:hypothetical protein
MVGFILSLIYLCVFACIYLCNGSLEDNRCHEFTRKRDGECLESVSASGRCHKPLPIKENQTLDWPNRQHFPRVPHKSAVLKMRSVVLHHVH